MVVYDDLVLVFANALHYNENDSQIAKDATTLKVSSSSVVNQTVANDA
jgi:Bromodomain